MQLLALGWCTSLISDSGLAIVNKNMHAEIVAVKGNSMPHFFPGFSYLPFMCSLCCIFYLVLPRLLCFYTTNRLFPLFSVDFGGERKRLGGSRVRHHHSSTNRSLFIAREDNSTCLIFDATPDTAYVNHFFPREYFFSMIQSKSTWRLRRCWVAARPRWSSLRSLFLSRFAHYELMRGRLEASVELALKLKLASYPWECLSLSTTFLVTATLSFS